jgi:hypothetical protein
MDTVGAMVLRNPAQYATARYLLAAEAASITAIVGHLSGVTGRSWRYRSEELTDFHDQMVAAAVDPVTSTSETPTPDKSPTQVILTAEDWVTSRPCTAKSPTPSLAPNSSRSTLATYPWWNGPKSGYG